MSLSRCPVSPCKEQANISIAAYGEKHMSAANELKFEPVNHSRGWIVGWTTFRGDRENFPTCNFAHAGLDFWTINRQQSDTKSLVKRKDLCAMREDLRSQVFHCIKGYYLVQTSPSPSWGGEIVRDVNSAPESGEGRRGLNMRMSFALVQTTPGPSWLRRGMGGVGNLHFHFRAKIAAFPCIYRG